MLNCCMKTVMYKVASLSSKSQISSWIDFAIYYIAFYMGKIPYYAQIVVSPIGEEIKKISS